MNNIFIFASGAFFGIGTMLLISYIINRVMVKEAIEEAEPDI